MAVLLGDSLPEDKGWIIFDAIDTELSGSANKNDLVKFLDDLIFVATEVMPIAAVGNGQDQVVQNKMTTYTGVIKRIIPDAKKRIGDSFFDASVSIDKRTFMDKLKNPLLSMISSAHELRIYLVKLNKEIPHKTYAAGADAIRNAFKAQMSAKPATTTPAAPPKPETSSNSTPPETGTGTSTPSKVD